MPPRMPICAIMNDSKPSGDAQIPAPRNDDGSVAALHKPAPPARPARETGGPKGPEPTRYGDWERNGRCIDF